ncbi:MULTISPECIES: hypothetical protein [Exiguobacterium]|uniref:hypothetical protein n=1 Tax=Exiguobacterium TaxID=33986 RepID=UPI00047B5694|nr:MULTISPECIES: hypothetical protein [Exiguobacterium]MCT4780658.1 hypothetical protein [Exiguobacterium soli]
MEEKMKHLEMIQNVITRMASNSFLLKGWTVTLVVGLLAFANVKDMNIDFMLLPLVSALFFWVLDAFYLHEERKYVKMYERVARLNNEEINFSLNARQYETETEGIKSVFLSKTLALFYSPILILVIVAIIAYQ